MVSGQLSNFGRQLRGMMLAHEPADLSDTELIERFVATGDEAAFEAIVRRHGPLVLGVCRRILGDAHDVEDAFQAVFVVLFRRIASLDRPQLLANWLYGVAGRTAREARNRLARRRAREQQAMDLPAESPPDAQHWADVRPVLDEELERLPEKYRVPVVLCDLQSRSRKEAAEHIGLPEGTLSSRLARARELLRQRLTRRGLALSTASLTALLAAEHARAALPPALAHGTVNALFATAGLSAPVVALSEGVLQSMFITKVKVTTALALTVALLGSGVGFCTHRVLADAEGQGFFAAADQEKPAADKGKGDKPGAEKPNADKGKGDKPAGEKPEKKEQAPAVRGVVKAVDAEKSALTLTVREGEAAGEHTVTLPKDVKIILTEKKDGTIADLKPRMVVMVQMTPDQKTVVAVKELAVDGGRKEGGDGEKERTIGAVVKAVDAAKKQFTITIRRDGAAPEDRTIMLASNAKLAIGGKEGAMLADLREGMRVLVALTDDGTAAAIRVAQEGAKGRNASAAGVIKSVDAEKRTLTLTVRGEGREIDQTFDLGKEVKTDEVKPGLRVQLQLTPDRKTVTAINGFKGDGDK